MGTYDATELDREARRLCGTTHGGFLWIRVAAPSADLTRVEVQVHPGGLAEAAAQGVDPSSAIDSRYPVVVTGESDPRPA